MRTAGTGQIYGLPEVCKEENINLLYINAIRESVGV